MQALIAIGATSCKRIARGGQNISLANRNILFHGVEERLTDIAPDGSYDVVVVVPDDGINEELQVRECNPEGVHPDGGVLRFPTCCERQQGQQKTEERADGGDWVRGKLEHRWEADWALV